MIMTNNMSVMAMLVSFNTTGLVQRLQTVYSPNRHTITKNILHSSYGNGPPFRRSAIPGFLELGLGLGFGQGQVRVRVRVIITIIPRNGGPPEWRTQIVHISYISKNDKSTDIMCTYQNAKPATLMLVNTKTSDVTTLSKPVIASETYCLVS